MSYVVHLWQQPVPATFDHAETLLRELRQQLRFAPDAAASELLADIESSLPAGGDGDACWSSAPEPDADDLVFSLSPALAELEVVLPAIEGAARRLGWVVFDPQSGEVRLPDGRVLSRQGTRAETPGPVPTRDLDSSPAMRKAWLQQALAPVFTRRGWQPLRGEFSFGKTLPSAHVRIYSDTERQRHLWHGVWLRMNLPARLQPALGSDGAPFLHLSLDHFARRHGLAFTHGLPPGTWSSHGEDVNHALLADSADAVARRAAELAALYDGVVLDWLDSLSTLQDLERWVNRVPDDDCPFLGIRQRGGRSRLLNYHPDLLLAAAVAAPDFEQRSRERVAMYEADAFGRGLLPPLRSLLAVCGLQEGVQ